MYFGSILTQKSNGLLFFVCACICVWGTGHLWQHFRGALGYDPARNLVWDQCVTSSQVTEDLQSDQVSLSRLESHVCLSFPLFVEFPIYPSSCLKD